MDNEISAAALLIEERKRNRLANKAQRKNGEKGNPTPALSKHEKNRKKRLRKTLSKERQKMEESKEKQQQGSTEEIERNSTKSSMPIATNSSTINMGLETLISFDSSEISEFVQKAINHKRRKNIKRGRDDINLGIDKVIEKARKIEEKMRNSNAECEVKEEKLK